MVPMEGAIVGVEQPTRPKPPPPPPQKVPFAIKAFTIFKIPVFIHFLFPIIIILDIANSFRFSSPFLWMLLFIVLDVFLFLSVLIHELGHCAATRCVHGHVSHILLWPLGGLAFCGHGGGPKQDVWISLCGPLTHIPQAAFWAIIAVLRYGELHLGVLSADITHDWGYNFVAWACFQQILLFAFNLLVPAYPLDGGRIFACTLIQCVDRNKTAIIVMCLSAIIGVGLIVWYAVGGYMLNAFVGAWILYQSWLIYRARSNGKLAEHPLFLYEGKRRGPDPNLIASDAQSSDAHVSV